MSIPIQNMYYLLSYAWHHPWEKDAIDAASEGIFDSRELLVKVLLNSVVTLVRRGLRRDYQNEVEEIPGIKGKLLLGETLKRGLLYKQRTICSIDNYTSNTLHNQIIVSTIELLQKSDIKKDFKEDLKELVRYFENVKVIKLDNRVYSRLTFDKNSQRYKFAVNVCLLINDNLLPSEKPGYYKFFDFTKDEKQIAKIFESFVRNFYRKEQTDYKVKSEIIRWQFDNYPKDYDFVPVMRTDITLESPTKKVIVDTKFYKEAMSTSYGKEKIKSSHLYQLFSYLLNQENNLDSASLTAKGILLYPVVATPYDLQYKYRQHDIHIKTVNLASDWKDIEKRLKQIIA